MQYDSSNKILTMSQTDLEHCGFIWLDFKDMMYLHGFSEADIDAAREAHTIVVAMHKGLYK